MEELKIYFPDIDKGKLSQFSALKELYEKWNSQINVISRKDMDSFYIHHVLHSLSIAKYISFTSGTKVLDVGTGGGFPGIPLAILFPDTQFHLVDSIGKKIKVVNEVKNVLELTNVKAEQKRAEELNGKYDFIISRAVTRLNRFLPWVENKIEKKSKNQIINGLLMLKGGDLKEELEEVNKKYYSFNLSDNFKEDFFETKRLVYIPMS